VVRILDAVAYISEYMYICTALVDNITWRETITVCTVSLNVCQSPGTTFSCLELKQFCVKKSHILH
jgi:hypothetical protein